MFNQQSNKRQDNIIIIWQVLDQSLNIAFRPEDHT